MVRAMICIPFDCTCIKYGRRYSIGVASFKMKLWQKKPRQINLVPLEMPPLSKIDMLCVGYLCVCVCAVKTGVKSIGIIIDLTSIF